MSYEVTLLVFGILLLLIGLIGRVKAQQLEVGTENPLVRVVTAIVGLLLVASSLNPDLPRSLLPALKDTQRGAADSLGVAPSPLPAPPKPSEGPPGQPNVEPNRDALRNGFRDLVVSEISP